MTTHKKSQPASLDYRTPRRVFVHDSPPVDLASFTLRLLGVIGMLGGVLIFLAMFTGIDDQNAAEFILSRAMIMMGTGITLFVLSVVVRRWERSR